MPENKIIPYGESEYPELEGLPDGSKVKFSGEAMIESMGGENKGLRITSIDLQTENKADKDLRMMNSNFVVGTYVSILLLTMLVSFIAGLLIFIVLLFFDLSPMFPFLKDIPAGQTILTRFGNYFWIMFALPVYAGL